jgi:hypothetical protein
MTRRPLGTRWYFGPMLGILLVLLCMICMGLLVPGAIERTALEVLIVVVILSITQTAAPLGRWLARWFSRSQHCRRA